MFSYSLHNYISCCSILSLYLIFSPSARHMKLYFIPICSLRLENWWQTPAARANWCIDQPLDVHIPGIPPEVIHLEFHTFWSVSLSEAWPSGAHLSCLKLLPLPHFIYPAYCLCWQEICAYLTYLQDDFKLKSALQYTPVFTTSSYGKRS